jgi:F-type H+-transporting ATPase subunit epsilon
MARTYHLTIATQQGSCFDGEVASLRAPGADGYFGVLPRHAPMIAQLGVGELAVKLPDQSRNRFAISGGICEISEKGVIVLADACEEAEQIDLARAEAAAERARKRLQEARANSEIHAARAEMALLRALNRLKIAGKFQSAP